MISLSDLSHYTRNYCEERISLDDFEDWFRDNSRGAYSVSGIGEILGSVEAALSKYYFQDIGEAALRQELAKTIFPFEYSLEEAGNIYASQISKPRD